MIDPAVVAADTTPQELMAVADALADYSDALDDFIKASPNPFTPVMLQLRSMDTHIASDAAVIARIAVENMAADVRSALTQLQAQISSAKSKFTQIQNVKTALSIVAAVFSVAANVSTGNPLGAAGSVLALVQTLSGALAAANN